MSRFLNGPVLNLLLVAGIGLSVYYATTLTERGTKGLGLRRQHGVRTPPGHPRSVNAATLTERAVFGHSRPRASATGGILPNGNVGDAARSVNVAYHRRSYPVDFRHRWILEKAHRLRTNTKLKAEHAHVQRLLDELRRARHVQAHETPEEIIRRVFGAHGDEAVRVASCETGGTFSPGAMNGQYRGIFQMGSRERAIYGDAYDVEGQARAAYRYFLEAGWRPWECSS